MVTPSCSTRRSSFATAASPRSVSRRAGYDFIKVYTNISREAYLAVVEAAKERGLAVAGHVSRHVGVAGALEASQHSIEHVAELDGAHGRRGLADGRARS
jgi:imidazolonepropionase-like amidohydrolase